MLRIPDDFSVSNTGGSEGKIKVLPTGVPGGGGEFFRGVCSPVLKILHDPVSDQAM